MIGAIRGEQIKLLSIRSPYWCMGVVVVLSLGITGMFSALISDFNEVDSGAEASGQALSVLLIGLNQFAVVVLMIMGVLGVTSEYRFNTMRTSFLAVPKRTVVLLAKVAVYVGLTFVSMLILTVISIFLLQIGIGGSALGFGNSAVIRQVWGVPVYASLCVLISMGVGALVRQTAAAISIVLVWMLVIETILVSAPKVRDTVGPLMPFANGSRFLVGGSPGDDFHWNSTVSLVYFAFCAIVVFAAGVLLTNKRDA